jgi:hypothetical protein
MTGQDQHEEIMRRSGQPGGTRRRAIERREFALRDTENSLFAQPLKIFFLSIVPFPVILS